MAHGAPLKLHHGSAISGRERDLIVGYEMDAQEGELINKEVTGLGGGSDGTIVGAKQMRDPIHGNGLHFDGTSRVTFTVAGVATRLGGAMAITVRPDSIVGTYYIIRALSGTTRYYIAASNGTIWTIIKENDAVSELTPVVMSTGKSYRILATWDVDHTYVYVDGMPVDDYATGGMVNDMGTVDMGGIANQWLGTEHEFTLYDRLLTEEEAKRDYIEYARRAWYQENLRACHVSSADVVAGRLENSHWNVQSINGTAFRIVDAPELEGLSRTPNVKAIRCTGQGQLWIPTQSLGLKGADPEAAYGTFEFWMKKAAGTAPAIAFISSTNNMATFNGYRLLFNADESVEFNRFTGGVDTNQIFLTLGGVVPEDEWFKVRVARRYDGRFSVYVNGILLPAFIGANPGTDNTHQSGSYILQDLDDGDESGLFSHRWGEML
jgi:hypothetical protein